MPPFKKRIEVLPSEVVDGLLTSCNGLLKTSLEDLADFANLFGNLEPEVVPGAAPSSSEFGVQLMTSRKGVETSKRGVKLSVAAASVLLLLMVVVLFDIREI